MRRAPPGGGESRGELWQVFQLPGARLEDPQDGQTFTGNVAHATRTARMRREWLGNGDDVGAFQGKPCEERPVRIEDAVGNRLGVEKLAADQAKHAVLVLDQ